VVYRLISLKYRFLLLFCLRICEAIQQFFVYVKIKLGQEEKNLEELSPDLRMVGRQI
jgi:hypothetical protein